MEPCTSGQKAGRVLQDIEIDMRLFYEKLPTRSRSGDDGLDGCRKADPK